MSYLNPLRLHFAGKFQVSPSTVNNDVTNYDNTRFNETSPREWNPRGDADWRLIGCRVTSAWYGYGKLVDTNDLILTCLVADSDRRVAAKLVDLDPLQQMVSAIWGMEVRICTASGETLLRGQYETASFVDIWPRVEGGGNNDRGFGAMYQSVLTDLEWGRIDGSPFLKELQQAACDGLLSIKFNVDGYDMDSRSPEFTRGRIVGTIGPALASEPRHCVRGRQFLPRHEQCIMPEGKINYCTAVVDQEAGKILLDLGNALPTTQPGGPLANQGLLSLVCKAKSQSTERQLPLGSIAYDEVGWYERTAGVSELPTERRLTTDELNAIATNPLMLMLPGPDNQPTPAIAEPFSGLYVRADQFVFRLNPGDQAEVRLIATLWGQAYAGAQILLTFDPSQLQLDRQAPEIRPAIPVDAIDYPPGVVAGADGVATVTIRANDPRSPRGYVDGQVYGVRPVLVENIAFGSNSPVNPCNFISLLVFDKFRADEPPTWWGGIQPIFQRYANLYPVMDRFLQLADYESVCANRQLLLHVFSLEPENPNFMPVVRDLSAARRGVILRWLSGIGQDGKPLLGTQPVEEEIRPATSALALPSPDQMVSPERPQGGKALALSRRLVNRPDRSPS